MQARCEILLKQDKELKYRRRRSGVQRRNGAQGRGSAESLVFCGAVGGTKNGPVVYEIQKWYNLGYFLIVVFGVFYE